MDIMTTVTTPRLQRVESVRAMAATTDVTTTTTAVKMIAVLIGTSTTDLHTNPTVVGSAFLNLRSKIGIRSGKAYRYPYTHCFPSLTY